MHTGKHIGRKIKDLTVQPWRCVETP